MNGRVRNYLEKVAGDYAFSPWLPLFAAAPMILGLTALEASAEAGVWGSVKVFTIATIAHAVMAGLLELARRAGGPWGRGLMGRLASAVSVYVALSQIRMGIIIGGFVLWDVDNNTPTWLRLLSSASITVFGAVLSSHALQSFSAYRRTRDALLESIVESERALMAQNLATEKLREDTLQFLDKRLSGVRTTVAENLDRLDHALRTGEVRATTVADVTTRTDRVWRDVSHELWREGKPARLRVGVSELFSVAATEKFVRVDFVITGALFMLLLGFSRMFPLGEAVLWSVGWGLVVYGVAVVTRVLGRSSSHPGYTLMAGSVLLMCLGTLVGFSPRVDVFHVLGLAVTHAGVVSIYLIVIILTTVTENRRTILDALRDRLDSSTLKRLAVESEFTSLAKGVAGDLHAGVRGTFLAGMMRVQKHLDVDDIPSARNELAMLREVLVTDRTLPAPSEGTELDAFLRNWSTVVDLSHNFGDVPVPEDIDSMVTEIVKNAVNDAIRHGRATCIDIVAGHQDGVFSLSVVNNGNVIDQGAPVGLGTELLDTLATAGWERQQLDGGETLLVARFALRSGER